MKTLKPNGLAILGAKDGQFPKRAISLLEIMREFAAFNICQWHGHIDTLIDQTSKWPAGALLSKKECESFKKYYDIIFGDVTCSNGRKVVRGEFLNEMGWEEMYLRQSDVERLLDPRDFSKIRPTVERLNQALFEFKMAFENELLKRKFVMIENDKARFMELSALFGTDVFINFPSARDDIQASVNCLALDLNTAAVFHLMRVAELGMRALARHLKVKAKKNAIDSAGWAEIIKHIGDATAARWQKLPKAKPARRKAVAFLKLCEVSADELNVFKEVWRNNVMHAGLPNNEHEAHGVYIRVRDFMQRLSKQVSEQNS